MGAGRSSVRLAGVVTRTLVVAAAVMFAAAVTASGDRASGTPIAFTISGSVVRMYPGLSLRLSLTVTNEEPFAIVVTAISGAVGEGSAGCPAPYLTLGNYVGALTVSGHGSAVVAVPVTLQRSAPDACQGAVFPLAYTGVARKA